MSDTDVLTFPALGSGPAYTSAHIWLPQLAVEAARRGEPIIEGKTFTDCFMEGPAVLLPITGCRFDGCNLGETMGDPRNLLLQPLGAQKVTGAVPFRDCAFINCRFLRVGFTGAPAFLEDLERTLGGALQ